MARPRTSDSSAALDAPYSECWGNPMNAATEVVMTITPPVSCRSMTGMTCLAMYRLPLTFTPITASQIFSSNSVTMPMRSTPALDIRPSMRPCASTVVLTKFSTLGSSVTSVYTNRTSCPWSHSSFASASPSSRWIDAATTLAPTSAKWRVHPSPMPDVPPVTTITRPSIPIRRPPR